MKDGYYPEEWAIEYSTMPYVAGSDPWDMEIPEEWEDEYAEEE